MRWNDLNHLCCSRFSMDAAAAAAAAAAARDSGAACADPVVEAEFEVGLRV